MKMMPVPDSTIVDYIYRGPWWKNQGILLLNMCLILPMLVSTALGMDSSLINSLQILPQWRNYYNSPGGTTFVLINSAPVIGFFVSTPFTPLASDGLGRRKSIVLGSVIMIGGVVMQVLAKNVNVLIGSRVIIGFGLSFGVNAAPLLITELAYPTQRAKLTSLYNSTWYLGSIISAWICFSTYRYGGTSSWSWRIPTLVQCLIPILQLCLTWFIPESPRWLVSKGRESEASRVLARYHANNGDERDPIVVYEMAQIRHAFRMDKEFGDMNAWKTLVTTPGNRRRLMIILSLAVFSQWSGNGLVSYYLRDVLEDVGITDPYTQAAINCGLQSFNFVVALIGTSLVDKLGRRKLFIISNIGMLLDFIGWTVSTGLSNTLRSESAKQGAAKATIPFIFIFFFFYDIAYTPLVYSYALEILSYKVRAVGFSIQLAVIGVSLVGNSIANPLALDAIGWKFYLVYLGWLVVELIVVWKYIIETKAGHTLEETSVLYDGEAKPRDLVQRGEEAATLTRSREMGTLYSEIQARLRELDVTKTKTRPKSPGFPVIERIKTTDSDSTIDRSTSEDRVCDWKKYAEDV